MQILLSMAIKVSSFLGGNHTYVTLGMEIYRGLGSSE